MSHCVANCDNCIIARMRVYSLSHERNYRDHAKVIVDFLELHLSHFEEYYAAA